MTDRDRLIELLDKKLYGKLCDKCGAISLYGENDAIDAIADHLIANGVTVGSSPCDLCRYNPPSSGDRKPCSMCPATPKEVE